MTIFNYIIVSVSVNTFGYMQKKPHYARKHSFLLSVVNKTLKEYEQAKIYLRSFFFILINWQI